MGKLPKSALIERIHFLGDSFNRIQAELYGNGQTKALSRPPAALYQAERDTRKQLRSALLDHFDTVAEFKQAGDLIDGLMPDNRYTSMDVGTQITRLSSAKLPLRGPEEGAPFQLNSPAIKSYSVELRDNPTRYEPKEVLAVIDKVGDEYHICFSAIPGIKNTVSHSNFIEHLAMQVCADEGIDENAAVHFYEHSPPESTGDFTLERFCKVTMNRNENGKLANPRWSDMEDTIPSGIDNAVLETQIRPQDRSLDEIEDDYMDLYGGIYELRKRQLKEFRHTQTIKSQAQNITPPEAI